MQGNPGNREISEWLKEGPFTNSGGESNVLMHDL